MVMLLAETRHRVKRMGEPVLKVWEVKVRKMGQKRLHLDAYASA